MSWFVVHSESAREKENKERKGEQNLAKKGLHIYFSYCVAALSLKWAVLSIDLDPQSDQALEGNALDPWNSQSQGIEVHSQTISTGFRFSEIGRWFCERVIAS